MKKLEIERRFLVRPGFAEKNLPKSLRYKKYYIIQTYLNKTKKKKGSRRVRQIWQKNKPWHFFLTYKNPTDNPAIKIEDEQEISLDVYKELSENESDAKRDVIVKLRICFKWKKKKFELDFFLGPDRILDLAILEIELRNPKQKVELPDFLPIAAEITNSPNLSNSNLAKRPK